MIFMSPMNQKPSNNSQKYLGSTAKINGPATIQPEPAKISALFKKRPNTTKKPYKSIPTSMKPKPILDFAISHNKTMFSP